MTRLRAAAVRSWPVSGRAIPASGLRWTRPPLPRPVPACRTSCSHWPWSPRGPRSPHERSRRHGPAYPRPYGVCGGLPRRHKGVGARTAGTPDAIAMGEPAQPRRTPLERRAEPRLAPPAAPPGRHLRRAVRHTQRRHAVTTPGLVPRQPSLRHPSRVPGSCGSRQRAAPPRLGPGRLPAREGRQRRTRVATTPCPAPASARARPRPTP